MERTGQEGRPKYWSGGGGPRRGPNLTGMGDENEASVEDASLTTLPQKMPAHLLVGEYNRYLFKKQPRT